MKILMHDNAISERGTTNALLSYAKILKQIGFEVSLSYSEKHPANNKTLIRKLNLEFDLNPYRKFSKFAKSQSGNWDYAYWIKSGENDGKLIDGSRNVVHAVFQVYEPHGQNYLYVSKWLASEMKRKFEGSPVISEALRRGTLNADKFEYLPHVVEMPQSRSDSRDIIRAKFGIGRDDLVGIRYGGTDTFDLDVAQKAVSLTIEKNSNLHYLFINTRRFIRHPRVHFLPTILDEQIKSDFLYASDFFIHGRLRGESFGLSIAEAMACGLPTYVWSGGDDRNHLELLSKEFWYSDESELYNLISSMVPNAPRLKFNSVEEFSRSAIQSKLIDIFQVDPNVNA